ncbi:MAG: hemolysin family protein [Candidatus Omnitrophica bacterium]|nr:hemolysin family protein [Candidatus Omnitrophota bacterium]
MRHLIEMITLGLLLAGAAFTAGCEVSILAANRLKLKRLAAEGSKAARAVLEILDQPHKFFSTILVANSIVGALIAVIVTGLLIRLARGENKWTIILSTLITSFLVIISEVIAKTVAAKYADRISLALSKSIKGMMAVLGPFVRGFEFITDLFLRVIVRKPQGKPSLVTEEEIRTMIKIGGEEGAIKKEKYRMLSRVFDFDQTIVESVMTLKKDIVSIDINSSLDDMTDKALECGYSRIPVHKDSPDNIVGLINMKDLLNLEHNKGLLVLQDILYPATIVPGSKKVTELLTEFQKGHTHIAIVTDQQGKVEGLITLEDLLEEIVGEIEDEYDVRSKSTKKT